MADLSSNSSIGIIRLVNAEGTMVSHVFIAYDRYTVNQVCGSRAKVYLAWYTNSTQVTILDCRCAEIIVYGRDGQFQLFARGVTILNCRSVSSSETEVTNGL